MRLAAALGRPAAIHDGRGARRWGLGQHSEKAHAKNRSNGQLPFPTDGPLLTVGELLIKEGKPFSRGAAKAIALQKRWAVVGQCLKERTDEAIKNYLVLPRSGEAAMLERDDVLVKLLEHRAKHEEVHVQSLSELSKFLPDGARRRSFKEILEGRAKRKAWPMGVGMLQGSADAHVFLAKHIVGNIELGKPAAAVPPAVISGDDFPRAFNDAFDQLRRERPLNLVELSALRRALPGFTREAFDRGLRDLRKSRQFVLETFEARHGTLSAEEAAAAIREDGRVFAFAARRDHG
jgi:hypothetical protein